MYKKYGIKKDWTTVSPSDIGFGDMEDYYPPFTAEKQLKLVDWFIKNEADIEIIFDCDDELYNIKADDKKTTFETFAEALASLFNIYFEDFTDIEIEEIKEILE